MGQGKGSAQSLACSWSLINVRYYYLLTFKIRRGDGAFRVPISSFLVPIGTRPSFDDGVGMRCAPGKAAPPTHPKLLTLLAVIGTVTCTHWASTSPKAASASIHLPNAASPAPLTSYILSDDLGAGERRPFRAFLHTHLSEVPWLEPGTSPCRPRQPPPDRRRDTASHRPLETGTLIGRLPSPSHVGIGPLLQRGTPIGPWWQAFFLAQP